MAQKPSIPKGTRDFSPIEMAGRNYIFDTIKSVFKQYGYAPLETPSMENLSTLMGKYGEEGDKLLFKILNSGDAFNKVDFEKQLGDEPLSSNALALRVCEKGLRYDLTVPFARYVVQHQNEITFPFKRYQIQPVWRADRPQKGRYREFYQCDVDVVGSNSLINELELVQIVDKVFGKLGVNVCVKINNRKLLAGLAEVAGYPDQMMDITIAIDKIDKIGLEAVKEELLSKGIDQNGIDKIEPVLLLQGTSSEKIAAMRSVLASSEVGIKGIDEIEELFDLLSLSALKQEVEIDLSLARGLNYYTGAIFEVKAKDFAIGSICGGGRYDDLTGIFGLKGVSGVGISFGADRIYDVIKGLDLFPTEAKSTTDILFANMGKAEVRYVLDAAQSLRNANKSVEIYPDSVKLRKQFEYADKKNIVYLVLAGEDEVRDNKLTVKNLVSGEQVTISKTELLSYFK